MPKVSRRLANALLVLYALLVGGLPLADAILPAATQIAEAHVEDSDARHHGMHDHVSCQICRAIDRHGALDGDAPLTIGLLPEGEDAGVTRAEAAPVASPRSELGARAPPTA